MNARSIALAATAATALLSLTTPAHATETTAEQHPAKPARDGWFVVADPATAHLYVTDARTGAVTGHLDGVELGSHAGTVQLGGGRLGFVDESVPAFDVLRIGASGRPHVVESHPIPALAGAWNRAGWISTDPTHRYVAIGSDLDGSTRQQVTLVDLRRQRARTAVLRTHEVTLATTGEVGTEELETFLVGDPLRLVVTSGGHLDAYDATRILRGATHPRPVASTRLGAYPHGPVVSADGTRLGTTLHDGVETVGTAHLRRHVGAGYPEPSVQAYRPRMAADGTTWVSTQAAATGGAAYLTSGRLQDGRLRTVTLGQGSASRVAVTRDSAVATVGSTLVEVAARRGSGPFTGVRREVAVPAGSSYVAASWDGRRALVAGAGGTPTLVDLRHATTAPVGLPLALGGTGYVTSVDPRAVPSDLVGR